MLELSYTSLMDVGKRFIDGGQLAERALRSGGGDKRVQRARESGRRQCRRALHFAPPLLLRVLG